MRTKQRIFLGAAYVAYYSLALSSHSNSSSDQKMKTVLISFLLVGFVSCASIDITTLSPVQGDYFKTVNCECGFKKKLIHQKVEDFSFPKRYIILLNISSLWFLSGIYLTSYNHKTTLLKCDSNRAKFQNISYLIFAYCCNKHITKVSEMVWPLKVSLFFKFETNQNSTFSGNFKC